MSRPDWLADCFAAVMLAVAAYSVGRLVATRVWRRPSHVDVDVAHVLMGSSMAGMLVPDLDPVPEGVWVAVFAVLAARFAWKCWQFVGDPGAETGQDDHVHRLSRRLIHLLMSLAMIYMELDTGTRAGATGGMAMGGPSGTRADFVGIPLLFLLALLASGIWELDGLGRFAPVSRATVPAVAAATRIAAPGMAAPDVVTEVSPDGAWLAPRLESGSHIAMCITMAYMLVLLL